MEEYCTELLENMSQLILENMAKADFSSLLNDFVESEFFLIDGDSLLVTCVCESSLKPGQSLHFFYLVERYLSDVINKGGQFAVVFFKDAEYTYFNVPKLLTLRTALILHLQKNTTIEVWTKFSGCFTKEWNKCLDQRCPYFLILADEGLNDQQTHLFNFTAIQSWVAKVNIVLFSGQTSDILRLYAYFMQSSYTNQMFYMKNRKKIIMVYKTLIKRLKKWRDKALTALFGDLKFNNMVGEACETVSLLKQVWPEGSDIRRVLCVASCSLSLDMYHCFLESREKEASQQTCKVKQKKDTCLTLKDMEDFCKLHCLSVAFLLHLPLSQRARSRFITSKWIQDLTTVFKMKNWCEYFILSNMHMFESWSLNFLHLSDLSDEPLLKNIAFYYEKENAEGLDLNVGNVIMKEYVQLWDTVSKLVRNFDVGEPFPVRTTKLHFLQKTPSPIKESSQEMIPNLGFIPLSCTLVDEFTGDILKDLPFLKSDDPIVTSLVKHKEFDELVHWHSHRPLSDDYDRTKANFNEHSRDPYYLKGIQKYHVFQRFYGNSLDSVSSKLITTQGAKPKKDCFKSKSSKTHETKADIIVRENKKRLIAKEEQKEEQRWNSLSFNTEEEMKKNLNSGMKKLEEFLKSCKSNSVKFQAEKVGLNVCLKVWKDHCRAEGETTKDLSIAVGMMKRIHSLLDKHSELLQEADQKLIARCLMYLGFDELANSLYATQDAADDVKMRKKNKYSVGIGPARFQLQYMGHYLIREERKDPDPRVQDFIPDTWQRELLDVVDNYESAVIVAPTSSGKTYASYYCMEKVLKESDEGVVVYVAPTKALVNQVAATVQHRYTKIMPAGEVVCGVFTREYRHDALNCQVLVTVPACFEILLLAPHRQNWVKRIRYVIFDEVHCLGGEIGAEIWEHLLVMIRCPFLALSATISNPQRLTEWLQSVKRYWKEVDSAMEKGTFSKRSCGSRGSCHKERVQARQSYKVRLVLYGERYNDMEKYLCSVRQGDVCFDHFHPCAALTIDHIEKYGFPSDLAFSPRESIQLYDTMLQVWERWPQAQNLCPETFTHFKNKIVIKKLDARKYEESLKEEFTNWIKNGNEDEARMVLKKLSPNFQEHRGRMLDFFPCLVEKLREMDKLPAIFFLFRLDNVEKCAKDACKFLENKQEEKRPPKADKEAHIMANKLRKVRKSLEKQKIINEKSQKSPRRLDQALMSEAEHNYLLKSLEKNLEIPQDCTYADQKAIDDETLRMVFSRVKFERKGDILKILARRGIGYHHSSMSAKEKQLVEILFRKGFIRVVTATGTLALGINMPCKSVVFAQNSVYLDALNFRQMSGRAGRRGQDLLGDVYFFDIPLPKVEKLIKSKVPELRGQFPLSISFILRLMLLASKADDPEDGKAKALSVLKHSLLSFKQPRATDMLKLYFLYSLQFLVKQGHIDQEGNPTGFAGLVSHLHYHEPSNLIFVSFLVKGLFHKLCQPISRDPKRFSEDVMEKLVLVLANLFGRRYFPAKFGDVNAKFYQSKVFLDDLPEDFSDALLEYNMQVTEDFASFLLIVSQLADMKQEYQLPLSKIEFTGKECEDSPLVSHLMNCVEGRVAVSPFVCLSGNFDVDLLHPGVPDHVILHTIGINHNQAPVLWPHILDNQGRKMLLNAYALDFYKHGSLLGLVQDNRLHEGDAYYLLKDFFLTIKSISVSLRELCENEDDNVVLAFEQLSESFQAKFKKV
ncbi:probable ATP-dependent RNA helicase DDX60 isoform X1 [Psammomys obesus]|uniref:probable ATP-dependent RNA helicase DDX60 isoform X1 n=1 Tax=Psammomys obesus TaxID=48139 RepID=UPI0024532BA1|nr:probable ATP-dependent RNA helicase DDX60 isoform X1 [Psammomys obesus]XP_055453874.1 probable ATP-dependent RNA helicase DDX60 isoform X1 [Psammomys obesus]